MTATSPGDRRTTPPAVGGQLRAYAPEAVLAVIAAGAALVLLLWWHDTPPLLHTVGDWLTGAGRITGLLGGYTIAVLLLLMSRAPVLERTVGADRLARWHAAGGRYAVGVLSAHAVLVTWGYAVLAHTSVVHQTGTLLTGYPDVLMATVALGLLIGVGAVSARAARRRLRYETWYYLHLYTYLATALAFSHQFADGEQFSTTLKARVAWSMLYGGATACVLWYRFAVPVRAAWRHRMRVREVRHEGPGVASLLITGPHLSELRTQPGQFFRFRFLTRDGWWQSHPFSLSAAPHSQAMRITVKELGDHSRELTRLRPGTRVLAEGPYGVLTAARRTRRRVLLLAGGVGITPLRVLFETLPAAPGELALVYRANHERDLLFRSELDAIAWERSASLRYLIGPPGSAGDPFVDGRLTALLPDVVQRDVFVCGPPSFVAAAQAALRKAGVPRRRVHVEEFAF